MNVLFTYDYGSEIFKQIEQMGYRVHLIKESDITPDMYFDDIDVLVCYHPFKRINSDHLASLKYILLSSTGFDQVPPVLGLRDDITITNNRRGYCQPIGEWIVMMLLFGYKNMRHQFEKQQQRQWQLDTTMLELTDKRVLFLGTGNIAGEAIKRLVGFNIVPIGVNSTGHVVAGFDKVYSLPELPTILADIDAVVISLPHTPTTDNIVDDRFLSALKDDCILINVSRGAVLDETALMTHLARGRFRLCALDVVKAEPLAEDHLLWQYPQVILTSHNSWMSEYRNSRRIAYTLENLRRIKQDETLLNVVDYARGY